MYKFEHIEGNVSIALYIEISRACNVSMKNYCTYLSREINTYVNNVFNFKKIIEFDQTRFRCNAQ